MENAAHALRIAGAIIIALLTIAVLVWGLGVIQAIPKAQENAKKEEEIVKFNLQYEAFDKDDLYGVDVISVMNKAIDNNLKYENDDKYKIEIEWLYDIGPYYVLNTKTLPHAIVASEKLEFGSGRARISFSSEEYSSRKYKCVDIKYNNLDGRISYMKFKYTD